jgi:hypothetical protein
LKKLPFFKTEGGKENSKKLPDCQKRRTSSLQKSLASLALVLVLKHTHTFKEQQNHDRQLPEHDARVRVRVLVPSVFMF